MFLSFGLHESLSLLWRRVQQKQTKKCCSAWETRRRDSRARQTEKSYGVLLVLMNELSWRSLGGFCPQDRLNYASLALSRGGDGKADTGGAPHDKMGQTTIVRGLWLIGKLD